MDITIEDGQVIGTVRTNKIGSECEFPICTEEEYLIMSEEEREESLLEAMWDSVEIYYK